MTSEFLRCYLFIDGGFVRKVLRDGGQSEWFDPRKPAAFVDNAGRLAGQRISAVRVFYYDAVDQHAPNAEQQELETYLDRVRHLPDTHVVTGFVRPGKRRPREQKAVDVQLAVDALEAAWSGVGAVAVVAGDADFIPVAEAVRRISPHFILLSFDGHVSDELIASADRYVRMPNFPNDWQLL